MLTTDEGASVGMSSPGEVLRLAQASVARGRGMLLDNVDWVVEEDERWVVIGPNGAGKTTLLQITAAGLHPTRGTVDILGERLGQTNIFDLLPRIGVAGTAVAERVPQHERVIDLVLSAAYGMMGRWREDYDSQDIARAAELLGQLGCAHLLGRSFDTLSEGERKRVQIARCLMPDPELLLLDEPAAGLDLGGREDLLRRLSKLAVDETAPALVLVTHHVEEVPPDFTHALLLRSGSVVARGPLDDVLTEQALSECFDVPLRLGRQGGRWTAHAR